MEPEIRRRQVASIGACQCVGAAGNCADRERVDMTLVRSPPVASPPFEVSGISPTTIAIAAAGGGLGLLALIFLALAFLRCRARRQKEAASPDDGATAMKPPKLVVVGGEYSSIVDIDGRAVEVASPYGGEYSSVVDEKGRAVEIAAPYAATGGTYDRPPVQPVRPGYDSAAPLAADMQCDANGYSSLQGVTKQ